MGIGGLANVKKFKGGVLEFSKLGVMFMQFTSADKMDILAQVLHGNY